jgi:hypothetical protein
MQRLISIASAAILWNLFTFTAGAELVEVGALGDCSVMVVPAAWDFVVRIKRL